MTESMTTTTWNEGEEPEGVEKEPVAARVESFDDLVNQIAVESGSPLVDVTDILRRLAGQVVKLSTASDQLRQMLIIVDAVERADKHLPATTE